MKNRHLKVAGDTALLKLIYKNVNDQLVIDKRKTRLLLCFKFIVYASLSALSYGLLYVLQNPFLFVAAYVLYGFVTLLFAFNFAHDFSHDTVFKKKRWNKLGFISLYAILGAHAEAWKSRHVHSHHYAPNVRDYDSDMQITSLIRVIPGSKYLWYHRFQHWYAPVAYMSYSFFWVFVKDFVILFSADERTKKGLKYYISFWVQKCFYIGYLLVLPALFSRQPMTIVLSGFIAMHLLESVFLLFTFFMTHHVEATQYPDTDAEGTINCSWLMNQVKSSNDFYPFSKAANFIFGGFNNHIAHHLFPHIHHIYYPALNKILYRTLTEYNIVPNQTTYWGGVCSHINLLRKMSIP